MEEVVNFLDASFHLIQFHLTPRHTLDNTIGISQCHYALPFSKAISIRILAPCTRSIPKLRLRHGQPQGAGRSEDPID